MSDNKQKAEMFDKLMDALSPKKKEEKPKVSHEDLVLKYKGLVIKSGFYK